MSYWVIRHEIVDDYLQRAPHNGRRWGKFESAMRFKTKEAVVFAVDSLYPGALALEVTETVPEYLSTPECLAEWYRERIRGHIGRMTDTLAKVTP